MRTWRISNFADLSGRGGLISEGRWHRLGTLVVYCTDHPSTALLEILVHATRQTVPDFYQLIEIDIPDDIKVENTTVREDWQSDIEHTRTLGMDFIAGGRHAILDVPSVVMPLARNLLLNPLHPDASRISVTKTYRFPFDSRLLKS
jgi:RES domain-containing protein